MKAMGKWTRRKKGVMEVPCDDDWFAGSSIFFVPHENEHEYMGTSVIVVPQLSGPPCRFFLYPGHAEALLKAVKATVALANKKRPKFLDKYDVIPNFSPKG